MSTGELWPANGIKALYHLSDVNDASGNGFNLTNVNTATFVAGKFGDSVNFGDSNTNKSLKILNNLGIDGSCTFMGWWKMNTGSGSPSIMFQHVNNTNKVWYRIYWDSSTSFTWSRLPYDGVDVSFSFTFDPKQVWNHFALTYDGTTLKGYINGSLVGQVATTGDGVTNSTEGLFISSNEAGANVTSCQLDEFVAYSRSLTFAELKNYYAWATGKVSQLL